MAAVGQLYAPEWHVYAVSAAHRRVAEIDDYLTIDTVQRRVDVGTWSLAVRADALTDRARDALLAPGANCEFVRNGVPLISGPVDDWHWTWSGEENTLEVSGPDANVHLQDRICYPTPDGPPFLTKYDVREGALEDVMKEFVDFNLGPSARSDRSVAGLTIAGGGGGGATVKGKGRFQTVLEMLQSLVNTAGNTHAFKIAPVGGGAIEFQVYEVVDRSATSRLQPDRQNVDGVEYEQHAPLVNAGIVGGDGEGVDRIFVEASDPETITRYKRRVETFLDQTGESDTDALRDAFSDLLAENAEVVAITPTAADDLSVQFGRDWNVGDIVLASVGSVDVTMPIEELQISVDSSGESIKPTLGTPGATPVVADVFGARWGSRFASRISQLERGR